VAAAGHALVDMNKQVAWRERDVRFPELTNSRITEFQAALLRSQLSHAPERQRRRAENAARLHGLLDDVDGVGSVRPASEETDPTYWQFVVTLDLAALGVSKDLFVRALIAEGIHVGPGHIPVHLHPRTEPARGEWILVSEAEGRGATSLPNVEDVATNVHIWLHHRQLLGDAADVDDIAHAIAKVSERLSGPDHDAATTWGAGKPSVWREFGMW
jgi:dTDP-4-amino-4,6-dideoxygalactose transaminase